MTTATAFLRKATGSIPHGGGAQLEVGTPEYLALEALFEQYDLFQMEVCEDEHEESVSYQQVMDRVELRSAAETFQPQFRPCTVCPLQMNSAKSKEETLRDQCCRPT